MEKELQPHQQRVMDEKNELSSKIDKLEDFLGTPNFSILNKTDQVLLLAQRDIMSAYLNILYSRISIF